MPVALHVLRMLLLAGEPSVEPFELLLRLAVVARVVEGAPVRISVVGALPQVDADQPARQSVLDGALGMNGKLAIVAIGAAHEAEACLAWELRRRA